MSLPFETITQRALRNIRQLSRRIASLYPAAYENVEGETTAVVGNDAGPYVNALGRASTDGTLGSVVVENGDPQIILTDELGRLWTRSAPGAAVTLTNVTVSVDVAGPIEVTAPAGKLYEVLAQNTEASGGTTLFLMIFDGVAAAGAPLVTSIPFVPGAVGDYDFTAFPVTCATGIVAAFSTDPYTYVAANNVGVITIRVL
jgi:hypothetical protein